MDFRMRSNSDNSFHINRGDHADLALRPAENPAGGATVKIDNFSFGPARRKNSRWNNSHMDESRRRPARVSQAMPNCSNRSLSIRMTISLLPSLNPGTYVYYCAIHPKMTAKSWCSSSRRRKVNPFDLKSSTPCQTCAACGADPLSDRLVYCGVAFDLIARWTKRRSLADAAYYNLLLAAISTAASGRDGNPRMAVRTRRAEAQGHPADAPDTGVRRDRNDLAGLVDTFSRAAAADKKLSGYRIPLELLAVAVVSLTGYLGGFLSGVNGPG